jgi:hypothetical protein
MRSTTTNIFIIEPHTIYTINEIRTIKLNETTLYANFEVFNGVQFFTKMRLLNNTIICENCLLNLHLYHDKSALDGIRWVCNSCKKKTSIRFKSFFITLN